MLKVGTGHDYLLVIVEQRGLSNSINTLSRLKVGREEKFADVEIAVLLVSLMAYCLVILPEQVAVQSPCHQAMEPLTLFPRRLSLPLLSSRPRRRVAVLQKSTLATSP